MPGAAKGGNVMLGHWNRPEETAEALRGGWMHAATAAPWTSIATCVVIGVPDDTWGERVHAVVVPADGRTVTLEELREFCAERIAGYKSPRSIELVEGLPLSAAGKVLKRELRKPYWENQERAVH